MPLIKEAVQPIAAMLAAVAGSMVCPAAAAADTISAPVPGAVFMEDGVTVVIGVPPVGLVPPVVEFVEAGAVVPLVEAGVLVAFVDIEVGAVVPTMALVIAPVIGLVTMLGIPEPEVAELTAPLTVPDIPPVKALVPTLPPVTAPVKAPTPAPTSPEVIMGEPVIEFIAGAFWATSAPTPEEIEPVAAPVRIFPPVTAVFKAPVTAPVTAALATLPTVSPVTLSTPDDKDPNNPAAAPPALKAIGIAISRNCPSPLWKNPPGLPGV